MTDVPINDDSQTGIPDAEPAPDDPRRRWRLAGCALVGLQAAVLAGIAIFALVVLLLGRTSSARNDALVGCMLAIGALGLAYVAREVLRGNARVRVPALLWQVLMALLVPGMWTAGSQVQAVVVALVAVATSVAVLRATAER